QAALEGLEQGTMEIVGDDDDVELLAGERPGAVFDIRLDEACARDVVRLPVERRHLQVLLQEKPRVPSAAAGDVEHRSLRNAGRPTHDPLRGRDNVVLLHTAESRPCPPKRSASPVPPASSPRASMRPPGRRAPARSSRIAL